MPGLTLPCVLMRAGTSRGPFFLREWLPEDEAARNHALIGAIGASDPLQLDGLGGGSTLNSKVAIVSRSTRPGCDLDYLFAQVGVGRRSVDTRPNCGNMLSGVLPFAIEQGLIAPREGHTSARVFNVNTGAQIDVTVCTPGGRLTYDGDAHIDGVAGTAAPILLDFVDAWGAVTGQVFPTGSRIDVIDGVEVTCIDAAMPLVMMRAADVGLGGRERPAELDANDPFMERLERLRVEAGRRMGLGDVTQSVVPKPVVISAGDDADSITSRYFTPHRCHASHAVTGAVGVATAFALPGTVASGAARSPGRHALAVLHPGGRIEVQVELEADGTGIAVRRAALVRTARKIMQGELHLPAYVFPDGAAVTSTPAGRPSAGRSPFPERDVRIIVPTSAGGGNDTMARMLARSLGPELGRTVSVDNRAGANGTIAAEFVAAAAADGHTLMLGYIATHGIHPALHALRYDPIADFTPIGLVGFSPTVLVVPADLPVDDVAGLVRLLESQPGRHAYGSAGEGTVPHLAAELFRQRTGVRLERIEYPGAAPAIADTARGHPQVMFPSLFTAMPYLRKGRLKALAVAGEARLSTLPGVPTLAEAGVPDVELPQWYGLFAPAGVPEPVTRTLRAAFDAALRAPDVRAALESAGATVEPGPAERLHLLLVDERAKWTRVVASLGLALDAATADAD